MTEVTDLVYFPDSASGDLYGVAQFDGSSEMPGARLVRWDGVSWVPQGPPASSSFVSLVVFDDGNGPAIFASGDFTAIGAVQAAHVAKWTGTEWLPLGDGLGPGSAYTLHVHDDGGGAVLYAGGDFQSSGTQAMAWVARWNGIAWQPVGALNGSVKAFASFDDGTGLALYAAGNFTVADGQPASRVARWDGVQWHAVGDGFNSLVNTLAIHDDGGGASLYAGGFFSHSGATQAALVAEWAGTSWQPVGGGLGPAGPSVVCLHSHDDGWGQKLYAGGAFTQADGQPANRVAVWDGAAWAAMGSGVDGGEPFTVVSDLESGRGPFASVLLVAGRFETAGGLDSPSLAFWRRCRVDFDSNCILNFFDVSAFLGLYLLGNNLADLNDDGQYNFFDVSSFLSRFQAGCD